MAQIPTDASVNIQRSFSQVNDELRALDKRVNEMSGNRGVQTQIDELRRDMARATRTERVQFWNDMIFINFGDLGATKDLTLGDQCTVWLPFAIRITGYTLIGDPQAGDLTLDIQTVAYPQLDGIQPATICGSSPPFIGGIAGARFNQDLDVVNWTQNVPANNVLIFVVVNVNGVLQATLTLRVKKTHFE